MHQIPYSPTPSPDVGYFFLISSLVVAHAPGLPQMSAAVLYLCVAVSTLAHTHMLAFTAAVSVNDALPVR